MQESEECGQSKRPKLDSPEASQTEPEAMEITKDVNVLTHSQAKDKTESVTSSPTTAETESDVTKESSAGDTDKTAVTLDKTALTADQLLEELESIESLLLPSATLELSEVQREQLQRDIVRQVGHLHYFNYYSFTA